MVKRLDNFFLIKPGRNGQLDGVRAIAILLIVLIHSLIHSTIPADIPLFPRVLSAFGWIGVPLFFVLSGYVVGGGVYESMSRGTFRFGDFYTNRSLRILPAAYAFLVISSWPRVGWNLATLLNFSFLINYYKDYAFQGNFYSLCIEEHFYLLFPLLLLLLIRYFQVKSLNRLAAAAIAGIVLVSLLRARLGLVSTSPPLDYQDIFRRTHTNLDFLLYGILAFVVVKKNWLPAIGWLGASFPFLLLLAYLPLALIYRQAFLADTRSAFFARYDPVVAIWAFGFVVLALTQRGWFVRALGCALFRWIAVLSFSMYLWNEVVMDWGWYGRFLDSSRRFLTNRWVAYPFYLFCDAAIMVLVALVSFALVERTFLMGRSALWRRKGRTA
jgi:peptidoglycan/LPS O-acetylase OafA/YrhL